jgi:surfactin synthase thioesterase subunit
VAGPTDWFVPLVADDGPRLFGFPHAGAGCAQLSPFARALAEHGVSLWSANLPGRQARLGEPARTDLGALADELADALTGLLDTPFALFGYCGGAAIAVAVVQRLRARRVPMPSRLLVASYEAPDIALRPRALSGMPSDRLWHYLVESGGVPPGLGTDLRLRQVVEPAVRADFAMLSGYRRDPEPPLPVPVTVLYGVDDPTPRGALLGWRRHSTYAIDLRPLPGGHWVLDESTGELAAAAAAALGEGRYGG